MSSPESTPSTPTNTPDRNNDGPLPFWAEDRNRAWSQESEDGLPRIPIGDIESTYDMYDHVEDDYEHPPEEEEAREIIHKPVQNSADQAVEKALSAVQTKRQQHEKAEEYTEKLDKKIKKIEPKAKTAKQAWEIEDAKNASKNQLSSRKQRALKRNQYKQDAKVRKLERAKNLVAAHLDKKLEQDWLDDEDWQTESGKQLLADMAAIDQELANRSKIRESLEDPDLSAELRLAYEQEASQWGGQTDEEFRETKQAEAKARYEILKKKDDREKRVNEQYIDTREELQKRAETVKSANSDPDPLKRQKALLDMKEWGESLEDFRSRVLGDNLEDFQDWMSDEAANKLQEAIEKADEKIGRRKATLRQYQDLLTEAQKIKNRSAEINAAMAPGTLDKATKDQLLAEQDQLNNKAEQIAAQEKFLNQEISGWNGVSLEEYEEELKNKAIAEFNEKTKLSGL